MYYSAGKKRDLSPNKICQLMSRHIISMLFSLCHRSANALCDDTALCSVRASARRRAWDRSTELHMPPSTQCKRVGVPQWLVVTGPVTGHVTKHSKGHRKEGTGGVRTSINIQGLLGAIYLIAREVVPLAWVCMRTCILEDLCFLIPTL